MKIKTYKFTLLLLTALLLFSSCTRIKFWLGLPQDNVSEDGFDAKIEQILDEYGRSPREIFDFVRHNIVYKRIAKDDTYRDMALRALNYRSGSCYHFASLTFYLLEAAGYKAEIIYGLGLDVNNDGIRDADEHYWTIIEFDGGRYHFDPLQGRYMKTDAELIELGYEWDTEKWAPVSEEAYQGE